MRIYAIMNENKRDLDLKFCKLFFSSSILEEDRLKDLKETVDVYLELGEDHAGIYNITQYIYNNSIEEMNFCKFDERLKMISDDKNSKFLENTMEYIRLATYQKKWIRNNIKTINSDFNNKTNGLNRRINKSQNKIKKLYSDFITLLGIFTAIAFAIFGSIQSFSSLFSKLDTSNPKSTLGLVLITGSIFGIIIYGILIVLFNGISKLTCTNLNQSNRDSKHVLPIVLDIIILVVLFLMLVSGICFFS